MLSAPTAGNPPRKAAKDLVGRVNNIPVTLDGFGLRNKRFHRFAAKILQLQHEPPTASPSGAWNKILAVSYFRVGRAPNYHRRWTFSLPSSRWDRVVPARHGRQENRLWLRTCSLCLIWRTQGASTE